MLHRTLFGAVMAVCVLAYATEEVGGTVMPTLNCGINHPWRKFTLADGKERMAKYKAYVRYALQDEHLVGVHWFFWCDMPLTGWMDGEDFGNGVTTVTDTPHPEMIEATRELARELYRQ